MKLTKKVSLLALGVILSSQLAGCPAPSTTTPAESAAPSAAASYAPYEAPASINAPAPASTTAPSAAASSSSAYYPSMPAPTAQSSTAPSDSGSYPMPSGTPAPYPTAAPSIAAGTVVTDSASNALQKAVEESKTRDNFFKEYGMNPFISPINDKFSTFGIDVDTASYTWMRKSIQNNIMVTPESVRTEEFINFFDYNYTKPEANKFSINTELANSRLGDKTSKILRIGIQGKEISNANRKDALLTFVIDVSGSMNQENRIALVKQSLELLVEELRPTDKVGIVVFGTTTKVVLEPTSSKKAIFEAINKIEIQGSTNTEAGLMLGYQQAEKYFDSKVNNRIILCSDGVANVGETGPDKMLAKIKQASESGISLSTIGFGMGNYNDTLMEQLADKGDGNYAYVDSIKEAQRIFGQNLTSTLQTIAKDTKIQVEFDPKVVKEYRLLGYENRDIADKDFRNDKVDAGEVGSNQSVTALYELKLNDNVTGKLANIAVRYKDVDKSETVLEINKAVELNELKTDFNQASTDFKLAVAVAEYADLLKNGYWSKTQLTNFDKLIALTSQVNDSMNKTEKVSELLSLITKAKALKGL